MSAQDIARIKTWIADTKRALHLIKRERAAFKATLSSTGYALKGTDVYDHALYTKANELAGKQSDLERTLKAQQKQLRYETAKLKKAGGAKRGKKTPTQLDSEIAAFLDE